jgi:hypothetical protein
VGKPLRKKKRMSLCEEKSKKKSKAIRANCPRGF